MRPCLYVAIPAMDELDYLPATLDAIARQETDYSYSVFICVNQPDEWWRMAEKQAICENNRRLIRYLDNFDLFPVTVLDYSSPGKGWKGKNHGVGWARKIVLERIFSEASPEDIMISLDADTLFDPSYFQSLAENFERYSYPVVTVPYYHRLTGDEIKDRAVLRYELYMRNWFLNMYRIQSPYAFTAIGSGIAAKIGALEKIGGITPVKSGEDFYLIQKLRKMVPVNLWNEIPVYPAARFSDRVCFGTGPAMKSGAEGNWTRYPLYHYSLFDKISEAYRLIPEIHKADKETDFISFLQDQFKTDDLWTPLRRNFKDPFRFERAFHEKADGLRILQFLKHRHNVLPVSDEKSLSDNMSLFFPDKRPSFLNPEFSISSLTITQLQEIRNMLYDFEQILRRESLNRH